MALAEGAANAKLSHRGSGEVQPHATGDFPGFFLWPRRNQPKFERLFMLAEQDVMGHVRERHGDSSPGAAFRLARGS